MIARSRGRSVETHARHACQRASGLASTSHRSHESFSLSFSLLSQGKDETEVGKDQNGKILIRIDPKYYRPTEVELLLGDPTKIKKALGWECKIKFEELAKEMVEADLASCGDKNLKW